MGLQLPIHEASDVIVRAMRAAGENLGTDFSHVYSKPGHQGFYVEIADLGIKRKTGSEISADYTFNLNIPYDYFNDDQLAFDVGLGLNIMDDCKVKAEIRCMDLITKTYEKWLPDHDVFTITDLHKVIREAQIKLEKIKHTSFSVASGKGETAEKYVEIWFTEDHIPAIGGSFTDRFFPVEFHINDYYAAVGSHPLDAAIGIQKLKNKDKKEICLLRVSYSLFHEYIGWLRNKWPGVYNKYLNGEF